MWVRRFQLQCYGVRRCVAYVLRRNRFHSNRQKVDSWHHVAWCLAKTSYPTSRWDVAVTNDQCSRTAPAHTATARNTETCSLRTFSSLSQTFCPPNSSDFNTVNLPSGVLFSRRSTILKISPQLTKWREQLFKAWNDGRHYRIAQSLPIHHFYHLLFTVNVIRQMAPLFSKVDSNKWWYDFQNEETMIYAKFGNGKDMFNTSKVVGRKPKWPRFFGLPGMTLIRPLNEGQGHSFWC